MLKFKTKHNIGLGRIAITVGATRQEADRKLVERARNGDQEAFNELIRTHRHRLTVGRIRSPAMFTLQKTSCKMRSFEHFYTLAP